MHLNPKIIILSIVALVWLPNTTFCSGTSREKLKESNQKAGPRSSPLLTSLTKGRPMPNRNIRTKPSRQPKVQVLSEPTAQKEASFESIPEPSTKGKESAPMPSQKQPPPGAFNMFGAFNPADRVLKKTPSRAELKKDAAPKEETFKIPTLRPASSRGQARTEKEKPAAKSLSKTLSQGDLVRSESSKEGPFGPRQLNRTFSRGQIEAEKRETESSQVNVPTSSLNQTPKSPAKPWTPRVSPKPSQETQPKFTSGETLRTMPSPDSAKDRKTSTGTTKKKKGPGSKFGVTLRPTFGAASKKTEKKLESPPVAENKEGLLKATPAEDPSQDQMDWIQSIKESQVGSELKKRRRGSGWEEPRLKKPAFGKGRKPRQ